MIYHKEIVAKLNRFCSRHFQNTPKIKTFSRYALLASCMSKNNAKALFTRIWIMIIQFYLKNESLDRNSYHTLYLSGYISFFPSLTGYDSCPDKLYADRPSFHTYPFLCYPDMLFTVVSARRIVRFVPHFQRRINITRIAMGKLFGYWIDRKSMNVGHIRIKLVWIGN